MCYSDFRKLYNKLFVCIDFPHSFIGVNFNDSWTKQESGGIPVDDTKLDKTRWADNPQYYFSLERESTVLISLLQPDGRLNNTKFPYAETTRKSCLIISRCKGKEKLKIFDNSNVVQISPIRQHRENSIYMKLEKGEYIISACTFKAGEVGPFCLEFYFEDSFIDSNYTESNFLSKFKNTKVERLDNTQTKVTASLKKETTVEDLQEVKEKKQRFIYNHFKNMLNHNIQIETDPNVRTEESQKRKKAASQKKIKDEEDYDEF
jgi:hypothetical protein